MPGGASMNVRAAFRQQAAWCRQLAAPFTALLCDVLAETLDGNSRTGNAVLAWAEDPLADALALRLVGALHGLVRSGHAPALAALYPPALLPDRARLAAALRATFADRTMDAWLLPWLENAPQTNEVGRSAVLMPGLMVIVGETGLPLRLFELGSSAGLNLWLDRWRYTLGEAKFGPDDTGVRLTPHWRGLPAPLAEVTIAERRGVDINPLDVTDPATAARLLAYVWPDQPTRLGRAAAAIAATAKAPPVIDRADAADWVEAHVATVPGAATVVLHSIAFQYFPADTRACITAHMAVTGQGASATSPLAWLRFEPDTATAGAAPVLRLTLWAGGDPDERLLARAHPHGTSIEWL